MNDPQSHDDADFTARTPAPRPFREQLWSPVQNTALWLAWWLHDVISADDLLDALGEVQGSQHQILRDGRSFTGGVELLRQLRQATEGAPVGLNERPLVSLLLAGPGDAPALPAGGPAYDAVRSAGGGLLLPSDDVFSSHVLVPSVVDGSLVQWEWFDIDATEQYSSRQWVAAQAVKSFSPGEADEMLRAAMDNATRLIRDSGYMSSDMTSSFHGRSSQAAGTQHHNQGSRLDRARLKVGSLTDAFGLPGLPPGVATRSARLMARADTVSAIIDVARGSLHNTTGSSAKAARTSGPSGNVELATARNEYDPFLLPLLQAVRVARITAVDYAQRELVR